MIFAVDDSDMDAALLRMSLERACVPYPLRSFTDGEMLLAELRRRKDSFEDLPVACLLDIKMSGLSGLEVLESIRRDADFAGMPVVVITSSNHPSDIAAARKLGAQCYLIKFPKPDEFRAVIAAAEAYAAEPDPLAVFAVPSNQLRAAAPYVSETP